jgi:hypothetical protein
MLFGSPALLKPFTEEFSLRFLGKTLFPVFSAKDLRAVTLDAYMKFDEHISLLVSKCMAKLCQIRRIRHLDKVVLLFVRVWANTTAKNVKKLQLVQNFNSQLVLFRTHESLTTLHPS